MKSPNFSLSVQYAAEEEEPPPRPRVRALLRAALAADNGATGGDRGEFVVRFVGAAESATLNRRHRRGVGATNVLAFAYPNIGGGGVSGDIVVCCPLVRREAARYRLRVADRYAHLIVHGALHLLGQRHDTPAAAARMEALEKRILARFGAPDPYCEGKERERA